MKLTRELLTHLAARQDTRSFEHERALGGAQLMRRVIQQHTSRLGKHVRFLTPDWHRGDLTDEEADRVEAQYAAHRAAFAQSVSGPLREIAAGPSLHDALIVNVDVNRSTRTVVLRLLAGDEQRGYFERTIRYEDVELDRSDTQSLAAIARDPASELLYDEVDALGSGLYSHGFLFWPQYREILLRFARVQVSDAARHDRTRLPFADRYSESGVAA